MLKYPCLILDHDDTVVQSEKTINYPCFCITLNQYRPGQTITWEEYIRGCCNLGFTEMCRKKYNFSEEELQNEYQDYKAYVRSHIPAPYPGIGEIIWRHKAEGGILCVISHANADTILRDYQTNFGILPDDIYGWDLPEEKRKPHTHPLECILKKYGLSPAQLLVVDDMKPAWEMASKLGVPTAFAGWSKTDISEITKEMTKLCNFSFTSPKELEKFLFD